MSEHNFNKHDNPTKWAEEMAYTTFDVDKAIDVLREAFPIRSVSETVEVAIKESADRLGLTYDAVRIVLQNHVGVQNVRNWLTPGKTKTIKRDKAIIAAFALKMPYEETEKFFKKLWLDGFHMRNIYDVVFRYGLENGWEYEAVKDMIENLKVIFPKITDYNIESHSGDASKGTEHLRLQYEKKSMTKEEFEDFIHRNEEHFGSYRRTAYKWFKEYYEELSEEWDDLCEEDNTLDLVADGESPAYARSTVSDSEICDVIIKGIPEILSNKTLDENLRKLIAGDMPGSASIRSAISEIINQYERPKTGVVTQVDRKLFLLAYLSSKDSVLHDNKDFEYFKDHIDIINFDVLRPCGMSALDARHPFDWIIMNSLRRAYYENDEYSTDDLLDLVDRMRTYESEGQ